MEKHDRERQPGNRDGQGRSWRGLALALTLGVASSLSLTGCGDDTLGPGDEPPSQKTTGDLIFLELAPDAPPFFEFDGDTSFVATAGEDAEIEIFFQDRDDPSQRGDKFLDFELEENSLSEFPDGTAFQPGDQVTITVSVSRDTLLVDFGPDGLTFSPDDPAELEIDFGEADEDFDGDGDDDPELEEDIDLWRQEQPGDEWFRAGDIKDFDRDEIRAFVESFTRWAVAI